MRQNKYHINKVFLVLSLVTESFLLQAQDTLKLSGSKIFEEKAYFEKYGLLPRELISFPNDSFVLERCAYVQNYTRWKKKPYLKRYGYWDDSYKFINDSILRVWKYSQWGFEDWHFKEVADSLYAVKNEIEEGFVRSLVPFVKHGNFVGYWKGDSIWINIFKNGQRVFHEMVEYDLKDSVFVDVSFDSDYRLMLAEMEETRKRLNKQILGIAGGICGRVFVRFVITKEGKIRNAKVVRSVDPFLDELALRIVYSVKNPPIGKRNSKPVNSYFTVPINMVLE